MLPIQTRAEAEAALAAKTRKQLQELRKAEKMVDKVKAQLDAITTEDLEGLRRRRFKDLKEKAKKMEQWRIQNHGVLSEVDSGNLSHFVSTDQDFFADSRPERLV